MYQRYIVLVPGYPQLLSDVVLMLFLGFEMAEERLDEICVTRDCKHIEGHG